MEDGVAPDQRALLIFDTFRGHLTPAVKDKLELNSVSYVLVPANLTNRFHPLDVSVNKAAKNVIRKCYSKYYRSEVQRQLTAGAEPHDASVDLRLSVLKDKHARWIVEIFDTFQTDRGKTIIKNGLRKSAITEAIEMLKFSEQDPFV